MNLSISLIQDAARAIALGGVLVLLPAYALSQGCPPNDALCEEAHRYRYSEQWREGQTAIPPPPRDEELAQIEAPGASAAYEYFIDPASISLGEDGVVRYSVVVRSDRGVRNVFHEGLRCVTDEVKTYAYGSKAGPFRPTASASWRPVARSGARGYQYYLARVVMCDADGYPWHAEQARRALSRQYTAGGVRVESECRECGSDADHFGRAD